MPVNVVGKVISVAKLAGDIYSLVFDSAPIAGAAVPGQFVHIKCGNEFTLRRPISICDIDGSLVRVVFELRGDGTRALIKFSAGDEIDVLGPLGNGFGLRQSGRVLVVGGGIGVPPLLFLAKNAPYGADAALGFRCADNAILLSEFNGTCGEVRISTDEGSMGERGMVTAVVSRMLEKNTYSEVAVCGPKVMLKAVSELCRDKNIPCRVSMEERMGCGVGACLVCSCKVKGHDSYHYSRVCKDGPVYDASEVIWDE